MKQLVVLLGLLLSSCPLGVASAKAPGCRAIAQGKAPAVSVCYRSVL